MLNSSFEAYLPRILCRLYWIFVVSIKGAGVNVFLFGINCLIDRDLNLRGGYPVSNLPINVNIVAIVLLKRTGPFPMGLTVLMMKCTVTTVLSNYFIQLNGAHTS